METTSGSAICWPGSNVDFFFASAVTVRMTGRYEINAPEGSFGHERKYLLTVEKKENFIFYCDLNNGESEEVYKRYSVNN